MPFRLFRPAVPASPPATVPPSVQAVIDRCELLTAAEIEQLGAAWHARHWAGGRAVSPPLCIAAHKAIDQAQRPEGKAWASAADFALGWATGAPAYAISTLDSDSTFGPASGAAYDAALAIAAGDLLSDAQCTELLAPWRAVVSVPVSD